MSETAGEARGTDRRSVRTPRAAAGRLKYITRTTCCSVLAAEGAAAARRSGWPARCLPGVAAVSGGINALREALWHEYTDWALGH